MGEVPLYARQLAMFDGGAGAYNGHVVEKDMEVLGAFLQPLPHLRRHLPRAACIECV